MDQIGLVEMGQGGREMKSGNDRSNRMEIVGFLIDSKSSFKGKFSHETDGRGWLSGWKINTDNVDLGKSNLEI